MLVDADTRKLKPPTPQYKRNLPNCKDEDEDMDENNLDLESSHNNLVDTFVVIFWHVVFIFQLRYFYNLSHIVQVVRYEKNISLLL